MEGTQLIEVCYWVRLILSMLLTVGMTLTQARTTELYYAALLIILARVGKVEGTFTEFLPDTLQVQNRFIEELELNRPQHLQMVEAVFAHLASINPTTRALFFQ